jgi:hypothetical protein
MNRDKKLELIYESMILNTKYVIKTKNSDGAYEIIDKEFNSKSEAEAYAKQNYLSNKRPWQIEAKRERSDSIVKFEPHSINNYGYIDFNVVFDDNTYLNVSLELSDMFDSVVPYLDMFVDVNDFKSDKKIHFKIPNSSQDLIREKIARYRETEDHDLKSIRRLDSIILGILKKDKVFIDSLLELKDKFAQKI